MIMMMVMMSLFLYRVTSKHTVNDIHSNKEVIKDILDNVYKNILNKNKVNL